MSILQSLLIIVATLQTSVLTYFVLPTIPSLPEKLVHFLRIGGLIAFLLGVLQTVYLLSSLLSVTYDHAFITQSEFTHEKGSLLLYGLTVVLYTIVFVIIIRRQKNKSSLN